MDQNYKYNSFREYLDALIADKETECIEFKHAKGGFPHKELWESYSSFANTDGGVIILGVKEKNGNFYPEGLSREQADNYEKIFWDTVNDPNQISHKLVTNSDVIKDEYNGNYFLVFSIPRASREIRPVFKGTNPMRGTYRRNSTGDYLCKEWEVALMFQERHPDLALDYEIQEGFNLDDIDPESLRAYRQLFVSVKPSHVWTSDTDLQLLTHLKAYRKDRDTGKEGLTLAGLLMFGKYDSITDALPQYMIDYREYRPGQERWFDRIYSDGSWECNLFQAYRRILPKLLNFLPTPFKLEGNVRQDETKAHKGLREAFVNFCVHSLFQSDTKLIIIKRPSEIIFSNPGTMLVSKEQYYSGGYSVCRNPALQTMFSLIGVAEKAGSGSDTIIQGWKEANFRLPLISEKGEPNRVELVLPLETILSEDTKLKLINLFGNQVNKLNSNELITLSLAISMPFVSNSILQRSLELHRVDITSMLRKLCKNKFLISSGIGRGTSYSINSDFKDEQLDFINDKDEDLENITDSHNVASNIASNVASNIAGNVASNIAGNIATSTRKHLSYSVLSIQIIEYCTNNWRTRQEIAVALCYNSDYLRNIILPRMISDGLIEKLDKEGRTNPTQKYRATAKGKRLQILHFKKNRKL